MGTRPTETTENCFDDADLQWGGMIGCKLADWVKRQGEPLRLADIVAPPAITDMRILARDRSDSGVAARTLEDPPAPILHLPGIVASEKEQNSDIGQRIGFDEMWPLLDDVR